MHLVSVALSPAVRAIASCRNTVCVLMALPRSHNLPSSSARFDFLPIFLDFNYLHY
jgi:hypothetical protein